LKDRIPNSPIALTGMPLSRRRLRARQ
jgi:hypothetical protein